MNKTIKHNFWYISCGGNYASGMWCPFDSKEEAIVYVKKEIGNSIIVFEGIDKDGDYVIDVPDSDSYFTKYIISQRKDKFCGWGTRFKVNVINHVEMAHPDEILKKEYAE